MPGLATRAMTATVSGRLLPVGRFLAASPGRANRKQPIDYDIELYKRRTLIEPLSGSLKDRRRIAMQYDRCAHTFFSAICIAATVLLRLRIMSLEEPPRRMVIFFGRFAVALPHDIVLIQMEESADHGMLDCTAQGL